MKFRILESANIPGDATVTKEYGAFEGSDEVGFIRTAIRDKNGSFTNPGYSVSVSAEYNGNVVFERQAGTFANRSAKEARDTRAALVREAKEAIRRAHSNYLQH